MDRKNQTGHALLNHEMANDQNYRIATAVLGLPWIYSAEMRLVR